MRLEQLATTDPLTQLLNRRALTERLTMEMERALRYDGTVALLMIDLDHFKRVNDSHGHLVGDEVLRDVSDLLLGGRAHERHGGALRRRGVPRRAAGDRATTARRAFAERIRERIESHAFHRVGGRPRRCA